MVYQVKGPAVNVGVKYRRRSVIYPMIRCQSSSEPVPLDCDFLKCFSFFSPPLFRWHRIAGMCWVWLFPLLSPVSCWLCPSRLGSRFSWGKLVKNRVLRDSLVGAVDKNSSCCKHGTQVHPYSRTFHTCCVEKPSLWATLLKPTRPGACAPEERSQEWTAKCSTVVPVLTTCWEGWGSFSVIFAGGNLVPLLKALWVLAFDWVPLESLTSQELSTLSLQQLIDYSSDFSATTLVTEVVPTGFCSSKA